MKESGKQKRFQYRLESVLKAREAKKKQQQATLSNAQRIQAEEQRKEEKTTLDSLIPRARSCPHGSAPSSSGNRSRAG